jgi:hypothetical protein
VQQGKGGGVKKAPRNELKPSGRCRLTTADVAAAIAWRLDGISAVEIATLTEALRPLAADFRESRPEVAQVLADLRRPGDRRGAWSLANAILARDAQRRGDVTEFILAGIAVIESMRRSLSNSGKRRSPLKPKMRQLKAVHPDLSPVAAFNAFVHGYDVDVRYVVADDALRIDGWQLLSRESFCRVYREL